MLEDFGNCVGINGRIIPAVNIQVENVPGFLEHGDGTSAWYGVYFEILFEQGYLWVVHQRSEQHDLTGKIWVQVYSNWAWREEGHQSPDADLNIPLGNWDEFLEMYDAKDEYWAAVTLPCHADFILGKM